MINENCRSKRRCLLSSLQGPSSLVRIAEYRKRTKKFTASYSAVIKLSFGESNEEEYCLHPSMDGWVLFRLSANFVFVLPVGVKIYFLYLRRRNSNENDCQRKFEG